MLKNELGRTVHMSVFLLLAKVRNIRTGLYPISLMFPTGIKGKLQGE